MVGFEQPLQVERLVTTCLTQYDRNYCHVYKVLTQAIALQHVEVSQTGFQGRPHEDYDHLKVYRLNESLPTDTSHYLMAALAEFHEGEPVPAQYPGSAVAYIIEGV